MTCLPKHVRLAQWKLQACSSFFAGATHVLDACGIASAATGCPACRFMAASMLRVQDQDADQPRDAAGDTAVEDAPEAK